MKSEKTLFIVAIIIVLLIVGIFSVLSLMSAAPKGFTELYFVGELPDKITGKADISFAIHNLEYNGMQYSYAIYVGNTTAAEDVVSLEHDEVATITKEILIPKSIGPVLISVKLLDKNQEIHFWVNNE